LHCLVEKRHRFSCSPTRWLNNVFRIGVKISINVQPTEKVGLIILVALTAHHTPIFTAHCELSAITWGEGCPTQAAESKRWKNGW